MSSADRAGDEEPVRALRATLCREMRELAEALREDAREELRRFVDCQADRLQQLLQERPASGQRLRIPGPAPTAATCSRPASRSSRASGSRRGSGLAVPAPAKSEQQAELEPPGCVKEPTAPPPDCERGRLPIDHRSTARAAWSKWESSQRKEHSSHTSMGVSSKVDRAVRATEERQRFRPTETEGGQGDFVAHLRFHLHKLVGSEYFDYVMGAILLLNAVTIGVQADFMVTEAHNVTEVPPAYRVVNILFCIVFALELSLRVALRGRVFWSWRAEGWKWNWFDSIVVGFSVLEELSQLALAGTEVQEAISSVGILRMLRLGRVARLVRMVRLIPELKSMVYLIMASMGSFFWTCILMTILMFCFAVYFTELASEMVMKHPSADMSDVLHYWGSLGQSILSLFQAMTGGDDWRNFVDVFNRSESSFLFNAVIISIYIAFTTLVMLNLVTGVFVEGAQRIMREDRHEALMKLASKISIDADLDSSACLEKDEFDNLLTSSLMDDFLRETGLKKSEADRLFYVFDQDNSGDLSLMEFVGGCISMNAAAKSADVATLRYQQKVVSEEVFGRLSGLEDSIHSLAELLAGHQPASGGVADGGKTAAAGADAAGGNAARGNAARGNAAGGEAASDTSSDAVPAPRLRRTWPGGAVWDSEALPERRRPSDPEVDCYWA